MGKLVILIALALCPALSAGNIDKKLPDLANLTRYGCVVNGPVLRIDHSDPRGQQRKVWILTVWASHQGSSNRDWKLWYSDRSKRAKALKDCDKWMERLTKKVKAFRLRSR